MSNQREMIRMDEISKSFGGVAALDKVNFCALSGEIHALIGENGAGKSTLMKCLAGAYDKDEGTIYIDGKKEQITNPKQGQDCGISVIYQEFALAKDLTVAENIFIDSLGEGKALVDRKKLKKRAEEVLEKMGFGDIDVNKKVAELTVAYQQIVEICKAISRNAKVMVFDEPTAVLTNREVEKLFDVIYKLRDSGVCVIYISHRLEEIFRICSRITVLKDGKNVDTVHVKDITEKQLVTMMIGRDLSELFPERNAAIGETVLEAENLICGKMVNGVTFHVKAGEVVGFAGLVGAGRTETMRAVFGADKLEEGEIRLEGKSVKINTPKKAIKNGIGMVPEDRKQQGLLLDMPIKVNGTMSSLQDFTSAVGILDHPKENKKVEEMIGMLNIKARSYKSKASSLSGGNQQKVALMKWMISNSKVIIFDEPTRGVDVGAKVEIYKVMNTLAEQGAAVIMISSEMPEIIGMSDRVYVMRHGKIAGEVEKQQLTEQTLINLSMGVS
ncbi:MAG: sugar ABC transporter ATP-binding protein [Clostridiales Family XIII bacterium]|uniref:Sugar ABC transporter ATP-binding protein n=1 Tax=Hominibacterium faecale TaxID=2839743 RepID=A0A9J6QUE8_9FIRM|nr:sugar ABC transporter ATP-binding protein [Hominibacterium faecale]MCI7303382.1 sugar ABC transporter ATP-binding protein [Clostridia bacterium]MCU7377286.1 sugar ABC transporter ATP-binding protein [Hominibacterium faecale]MDE8733159.1 sugar ABC transporter ATP-binding protein [Eubacteriales bacterium DFI.9.88]MDY3009789.1 sugar ABC transporter ATP-binding protein [Clostridiales Family XIII bacterium]